MDARMHAQAHARANAPMLRTGAGTDLFALAYTVVHACTQSQNAWIHAWMHSRRRIEAHSRVRERGA
eukprot:15463104-Alexandrium_andersonii.AAC.1